MSENKRFGKKSIKVADETDLKYSIDLNMSQYLLKAYS